jgi:hypothetical protein
MPGEVVDNNKSNKRTEKSKVAAGTETGQYTCLSGPMSGRIRDHHTNCQVVQMADPKSQNATGTKVPLITVVHHVLPLAVASLSIEIYTRFLQYGPHVAGSREGRGKFVRSEFLDSRDRNRKSFMTWRTETADGSQADQRIDRRNEGPRTGKTGFIESAKLRDY